MNLTLEEFNKIKNQKSRERKNKKTKNQTEISNQNVLSEIFRDKIPSEYTENWKNESLVIFSINEIFSSPKTREEKEFNRKEELKLIRSIKYSLKKIGKKAEIQVSHQLGYFNISIRITEK